MKNITVSVVPGLSADSSDVRAEGQWDLGLTLSPGGVIGAFDAWLAKHGMYDKYEWRYTKEGRPRGMATPIHVDVVPDIKPEALSNHLWDNLEGASTTHFSTSLQRSVTQERSVTWDTKLSISDTYTVEVGIEGGPLKAGAQNSVSVTAEVGHSSTSTESVQLGTTDEVSTDLEPGKADLVVLVAYVGSVDVVTTVQTAWVGSLEWRYNNGAWQTMDARTLMDHGLARPFDPHGTHFGIVKMTSKFGVAGEVDQKIVAVKDTSPVALSSAQKEAVASIRKGASDEADD